MFIIIFSIKIIHFVFNIIKNFFFLRSLKNRNISLLMFFPFFSSDTNNSHFFSFFAVTTTLIFTWYYKETITNFWKSWWNKNKENVNTNNNSNSTTKTTSEEPKVEQSEEVATATTVVKDEALAPTITQSEVATAPIVEQSKTIVVSSTTITQSESQAVVVLTVEQSEEVTTATTVVKDEALAPTITQAQDEVSAAPSDNISETISKKWYDYSMDKIQVVSITDENRMIPQGTLEFSLDQKLTTIGAVVKTVNWNICTSIKKSHQDGVDIGFMNLHDFKNSEEILVIKQKFLTSTEGSYETFRKRVEYFIELNKNKKIELFVDLKKPLLIEQKEHTTLIELDPIESYEEIIDKTIDGSEIFINVTRIGLYDHLLSRSIGLLCMDNYFFLTDSTIKVEKNNYINILSTDKNLILSSNALKRKISILKKNYELEDYILNQEYNINLHANVAVFENYEKCQEYYFSNYYKNLNLCFSENQQIDLFNRLITKEYFDNISNASKIPCLDSLSYKIETLNCTKDNILRITKKEVIPIGSNKVPSKVVTDTILTDIYDLQPNTTDTSKDVFDQIALPAKDISKIYNITNVFLETKYEFYIEHIDKVNDLINIILTIKN